MIRRGDTFYRIAKEHGISVEELYALNDFDQGRVLKPGQTIRVPAQGGGQPVAVAPPPLPKKQSFSSPSTNMALPKVKYNETIAWPVNGQKEALTGRLQGVRIEASESSMVQSVATGNVVWIGPFREFGQVVLIDVGGYVYLYGGNEDIFVNVGEHVPAGTRIGRLGSSSLASRTVSMYFSVFKDGVPVSVVSAPRG